MQKAKELQESIDELATIRERRYRHDLNAPDMDAINELIERQKDVLFEFEAEAGLEVDDAGKKLYTNKEQRQQRAKELAALNEFYTSATATINKLRAEKARYDIDKDDLKRQFKVKYVTVLANIELLHSQNQFIEVLEKGVNNVT